MGGDAVWLTQNENFKDHGRFPRIVINMDKVSNHSSLRKSKNIDDGVGGMGTNLTEQ